LRRDTRVCEKEEVFKILRNKSSVLDFERFRYPACETPPLGGVFLLILYH
jgi:hypothetical protein